MKKLILFAITGIMLLNSCDKDELAKDHPCQDTEMKESHSTFCLTNYSPVCACDGNTYGNECEANRNGMTVLYNGKCN